MVVGIGHAERWFAKDGVEIFVDDAGFDDDPAVMDQGRDNPIGIKCHIFGLEMFILAEINRVVDPFEIFLGERQPHLLRANGSTNMIELEQNLSSG